jgi:hypothetical protein
LVEKRVENGQIENSKKLVIKVENGGNWFKICQKLLRIVKWLKTDQKKWLKIWSKLVETSNIMVKSG